MMKSSRNNMISLVIIAKDAQDTIFDCISSASQLVNETIVILDPKTSDSTKTEIQKTKAKIIEHPFDNFSQQKNFGNSQAKNDWILSLDADEKVSEALSDEIKNLNLVTTKESAYSIPRLNYFFKQPVLHSNWGPQDDRQVRLFKKSNSSWEGKVHESITSNGRVGQLHQPLLHYPYDNVSQFVTKLNKYTSSETKFQNPIVDFFRRFIWHQGYKDGLLGLFLAYLMIIYHTTVGIKLWLKPHSVS